MDTWSVTIEAVGPGPYDCDWASDVIDALQDRAPAISVGAKSVGLTFDVTAADAVGAAKEAVRVLAAIQPELEVVEVRAQRAVEQERQLRESNVPELLGVAELAQALGVSRQRVSELAGADGFPAPMARLRSGPVWQRSALGRFLAQWQRKPGRPRKAEPVTPCEV